MRGILLTVFTLFTIAILNAQTTIKLEEVNQHVGDSVTVCGKVTDTRYQVTSKNSPTFLNMGGKYPDQLLSVVIWADAREKLRGKPEEDYKNKEICVTGKIELYKTKPQIVIKKASQIKLKE